MSFQYYIDSNLLITEIGWLLNHIPPNNNLHRNPLKLFRLNIFALVFLIDNILLVKQQ